jgi:hypothetical protein
MTSAGRYHLLLTSDGRPIQHGWWESEATARHKFRRWVGEYGTMPGARITPHRRGHRHRVDDLARDPLNVCHPGR